MCLPAHRKWLHNCHAFIWLAWALHFIIVGSLLLNIFKFTNNWQMVAILNPFFKFTKNQCFQSNLELLACKNSDSFIFGIPNPQIIFGPVIVFFVISFCGIFAFLDYTDISIEVCQVFKLFS